MSDVAAIGSAANRSADGAAVREPVTRPGARRADKTRKPVKGLGVQLVVLAVLQMVIALDVDLPVVRPLVALTTFVALPALLVHRRTRLQAENGASRFAYAAGLSLLLLLVVGLTVNWVVPVVGTDEPLTAPVLAFAWFVVDGLLLAWRRDVPLATREELAGLRQRAWDARVEPAQALGVLALLLSVVGAVRLNNGAGGQVAVLALLLAIGALLALMLREGSLSRDAWTVFLVSLALLLATSLRGWGITGHDVQAEYYVFSLTADAHHWSMDLLQNAYTACLSVTLLPTLLTNVTGLSGVFWFKIGLQVAFALAPVLLFLTFRRLLSRRLALVSVALVVAFPTFNTDMPYLVRQEVAFLFLALVLLVATEPAMWQWTQRILVVTFGLGVVLSHYSTTYLLGLALGGALVLLGILVLADRRRGRKTERPLVLLHPATVLLLALTALIWTGPVTHTGGHPIDVARDAITSMFDRDAKDVGSSDRNFFIFGGKQVSERERLDQFVDATLAARKEFPRRLALVKDPGPADTRPALVEPSAAPVTPVGTVLEKVGVDLGSLTNAARLLCAVLIQLLLLIGLWWMVRERFRRRSLAAPPQVPSLPAHSARTVRLGLRVSSEQVCLVLGVMGALALVVVVPSLSVEYGVLRAFLQSMFVLAPVAALGLWVVLGWIGRRTTVWLTAVTVVVVAVFTSALPSLIGGGPAKPALANAGLYYDRYVVPDSDRLAAERIAQAPDLSGALPKVLAPRHQAVRLVQAGVPATEVADRTYPTVLNVDSYLFADALMTRERRDTIFYQGDRITYRYPLGQIGRLMNLVYCAGNSRVYR
ncbi:hypothetical protein [Nocardioides marmoribigeumensis]|uniref:Membrane protein n=1 Tax=Nocardioides marmoribigeumensis TaxID=433649 RepID=A0ABU2BTR3_9ACTN|nr:hypothetical protein [Nocardioides marmoribigeumensis]MDR7362015.1 putative membrane protein [Nocardioides marmoribigeumensis]